MKALFAFGDISTLELNTSYHRAIWPVKMLQEAGYECQLTHAVSLLLPAQSGDAYGLQEWNNQIFSEIGLTALYGKDAYDAMRWADVVVIERTLFSPMHTTIKWLRSIGKSVICTFDDAYHLMPLNNAVKDKEQGILGPQGVWRGGKNMRDKSSSLLSEFRVGLGLCSGAIVPSKVLAEDYRRYQPNIQVVPNYLYEPLWENPPVKDPDKIIIGYGASSLHGISLKESGVLPALQSICRKYPKVIFHLQPPHEDMVRALQAAGVRFITSPFQKFTDWPKTVAKFNIGIAPLAQEYDRRRSSLKVLEYATAGVPWIATDDAPYQDCRGGILVRNKKREWERALDELISNLTLDRKLSNDGRIWASGFNQGCVSRYLEVFNGY